MSDDRVTTEDIHQLLGEMIDRGRITKRQVEEFRRRPSGPTLPFNCKAVVPVPTGFDRLLKVFLDVSREEAQLVMLLGKTETSEDGQVVRHKFLQCSSGYYQLHSRLNERLMGFVDGLPLYYQELTDGLLETEIAKGGFGNPDIFDLSYHSGLYLGTELLSKDTEHYAQQRAAQYHGTSVTGANGGYHSYHQPGGMAFTIEDAPFGQMTYKLSEHSLDSAKMLPQPPFLHLTPPFKSAKLGLCYWGSIGSHACLMQLKPPT